MTRKEIIDGLKYTVDMFLFDATTGETYTEPRNDMDKITIDACRGAIKELQDNSYELWKESYEVEHERNFRLEEKINALEQEPKTGHWKIIPFSNNHGEYRPNKYACSECGWEIDLCRGLQQDTGHRLFCEHCGAKMVEP